MPTGVEQAHAGSAQLHICRTIGADAEKFGQQTVSRFDLPDIFRFEKNFFLLYRSLLINSDKLPGKFLVHTAGKIDKIFQTAGSISYGQRKSVRRKQLEKSRFFSHTEQQGQVVDQTLAKNIESRLQLVIQICFAAHFFGHQVGILKPLLLKID